MPNAKFAILSCVLLPALGLCAFRGQAAPLIESEGRLEVNWGAQKVRFYGEAKANDSDGGEALRMAEKKAWQDGLNYVADAARDLNVSVNEALAANPETLASHAKEAAKQVAQSTYSTSTTYFQDGTVRVHLENSLAKAVDVTGIRFKQKEAATTSMTHYTGLVLKLDRAVRPRAAFTVVDEAGGVLYDVHDLAEDAYRRSLMGRWYKRPSPAETAEAAGKNPVVLEARAEGSNDRFVVKRADWVAAMEGQKSLLANGSVLVAVP
jgi:hypothetical protein